MFVFFNFRCVSVCSSTCVPRHWAPRSLHCSLCQRPQHPPVSQSQQRRDEHRAGASVAWIGPAEFSLWGENITSYTFHIPLFLTSLLCQNDIRITQLLQYSQGKIYQKINKSKAYFFLTVNNKKWAEKPQLEDEEIQEATAGQADVQQVCRDAAPTTVFISTNATKGFSLGNDVFTCQPLWIVEFS